ncbi:MAG: hypothetical protein IH596_03680 [Bacteroidales bacterium]|nr:hypothetical protein [Bacteroidales bacterium]
MKKYLILTVALIWATTLTAEAPSSVTQVDLYYFHFSRRCATCLNVEKVTKESVESLFPDQVKQGEITFQSINLDEDEGEAIGKKNNIEGQTLIVICGEKRVDLTDKGFLYANGNPEKLKAEIKKAVEEVRK